MKYRIYSKSGEDFGTWEGKNEACALVAMLRDAGYDLPDPDEDGYISYPDEATAEACGPDGVCDWSIVEIR